MVHRNGFGDTQAHVRNIHVPRLLSAWCNFTWDLRIDAFQVHTCPRAKVCGRGEKLEGEDLVPFMCSLLKASIIVFWILEIGINQYLEYLFEDRFNSIWNERIEETWFTNAYERVSRNSDDSISRNLISSKNIENIYLFDTVVNNSNKFLGIRSVRILRMLFSQNDSILNLKMVKSLLNHKRVGGIYFSLKFKQLVFVNFSPLVRLICLLLKVHLIWYQISKHCQIWIKWKIEYAEFISYPMFGLCSIRIT